MVERGADKAPLIWSMSYSPLCLLSIIRMSDLLSIFCNNSSIVIRGTSSEGAGLVEGSGTGSGVGASVGNDVHAIEASNINIATGGISFLR